MRTWLDVLRGPSLYRANTPWGPAAAIGTIALIVLVQLTLPLVVYGLFPEFYQVISGETGQPKIWLQPHSPTVGLLQQIVTGCLVWFAAGLGNGKRRDVLSLPPLKGGAYTAYTYVALALLVFGAWVPVKLLSQVFLSLLHSLMILSVTVPNPTWPWMSVLVVVIATPLVEEFMYRGFLLSALSKSKIGFWGAAIISDAAWTATHAAYQSWDVLLAIFVSGLLLSFLLWRTGSLWTCIFAHMTVNAEALLMQAVVGLVFR
jgi:membrane protease YdiL (CAAX protease family)